MIQFNVKLFQHLSTQQCYQVNKFPAQPRATDQIIFIIFTLRIGQKISVEMVVVELVFVEVIVVEVVVVEVVVVEVVVVGLGLGSMIPLH